MLCICNIWAFPHDSPACAPVKCAQVNGWMHTGCDMDTVSYCDACPCYKLLEIERSRFGTAARLAAWAGVAPGNDESAGKRRSGTTRKGNRALRTGLVQLAHSATHTKETYLVTLFRRLATRRGKQRAIIAVAHSIMVSVFSILIRHEPYRERGATHFDRLRHSQSVERLTRRLEQLGYAVHLEPRPVAA